MATRINSLFSKLISFCLILLGFSSCLKDDPVDEYGTPSAKYKVKGKVVSKDTPETAIENIRVVMIRNVDESKDGYIGGDTVYTNKSGQFEINREDFPQNKFKIKIADIDGDKNGSFEGKETIIEFTDSDYSGGKGGWYKGEATKDMGSIELTPQKKD